MQQSHRFICWIMQTTSMVRSVYKGSDTKSPSFHATESYVTPKWNDTTLQAIGQWTENRIHSFSSAPLLLHHRRNREAHDELQHSYSKTVSGSSDSWFLGTEDCTKSYFAWLFEAGWKGSVTLRMMVYDRLISKWAPCTLSRKRRDYSIRSRCAIIV